MVYMAVTFLRSERMCTRVYRPMRVLYPCLLHACLQRPVISKEGEGAGGNLIPLLSFHQDTKRS